MIALLVGPRKEPKKYNLILVVSVVVMACDDEIVPLQKRIETVSDDTDLEEVYNTERHLLYVACTRARDHLLVTSVDPGSEFLDDMRG